MDPVDYDKVVFHYSREEVKEEIACFSRGRWVAIHCQIKDEKGRPYLLRYQRFGRKKFPLKIEKPEDVSSLINRFRKLQPRTFYASANVYKELATLEHVRSLNNISLCLPTWDIDNELVKWKATVEAAREILYFLKEEGVSESVFLKWSGNGLHIHIHHKAFSQELLRKLHPLDVAYAIVEYVNTKLGSRYVEVARKYKAKSLRVENKMDIQRVFTCPLSLHRYLDVVAVCMSPKALDEFSPSWLSLDGYKHWREWDSYVRGEADQLARKAYESVGGYPVRRIQAVRKRKTKSTAELISKWLRKRV